MDWKKRFQQELRDAMRAQDEPRVNVIRMVMAALEKAQEEKGKQAFEDASNPDGADILADREQSLSGETIREIIHAELEHRREAVDVLRNGGQNERADSEEGEIAILEQYLRTI